MNKWNWIKMGLKLIKVSLVFALAVLLTANVSKMVSDSQEDLDLNMTLGVIASLTKEEEEKPSIVEEEPKTSVVTDKKIESSTQNKTQSNTQSQNNAQSSLKKLSGDLTGYAADCPLCNGTLACKSSYKVYKNNVVTYPDSTYGNVRIVASSKNLTCGSIIKFEAKSISNEPIIAIVLDRGVRGNNIDLLMPTEDAARKNVGRKKITYEVLRNGW